jgi:hypothetical protein
MQPSPAPILARGEAPILAMLVGSHFRPPAKQVLAVLPAGAELSLRPEPENPYDPDAIAVYGDVRSTVPIHQYEALEESLEGTGTALEDLLGEAPPLHLGYIARSGAPTAKGYPGNLEVGAELARGGEAPRTWTLAFSPEGFPMVKGT